MVLNFTTRNIFSSLPGRACVKNARWRGFVIPSLARICNPCYYPQHPEYRTEYDKPNQRKGKIENAFEEMTVHELVAVKGL